MIGKIGFGIFVVLMLYAMFADFALLLLLGFRALVGGQ